MTEERSLAASKNGCHPSTLAVDSRVPDGVDAAKDPLQPTGLEPALDRSPSKPELDQLAVRDDAVLTSGQLRDPVITWST